MDQFMNTRDGQKFLGDISKIAKSLEQLALNTTPQQQQPSGYGKTNNDLADITDKLIQLLQATRIVTINNTDVMASIVEFFAMKGYSLKVKPILTDDNAIYEISIIEF